MSSHFEVHCVNGPSGDPAVLVSFLQWGQSLLFDAGGLETLSTRDILKIRVVAVSHTHVDHFIGFDKIIRANVPHFRTLEVVGPEGITKNVQAKLQSYTWNLLEDDQLTFIVHEVNVDGSCVTSKLVNQNHFEPVGVSSSPPSRERVQIRLQGLRDCDFYAVTVDHGIPVLAFHVKLPDGTSVDKEALKQLQLEPGPWISELQKVGPDFAADKEMIVGGKVYTREFLRSAILKPKLGPSIGYATDLQFNPQNLAQLKKLSGGFLDLFYCETNYRHEDREKALRKSHLTTKQAALIASVMGTRELRTFHISNIYSQKEQLVLEEAAGFFNEISPLSPEKLLLACKKEFPGSAT